jgi:hypothetical protein
MRYRAARSLIRSGDVILFRGRGPIALLIRSLTHSDYDHCAVAWVIGGRVLLVEARMLGGVRVNPLSRRLADLASWQRTGIDFDDGKLRMAIRDLGRPYSFVNCFRALADLPGIRRQYECAQLVAEILRLGEGGWTPQRVREYFHALPTPLEA